ncbi:glycosyltransferase family 4 protein [Candidatus Margulisiibacteriota bacterium]
MRVLFLTIDDASRASSRVRVYNYLPLLKERNVDYKVLAWNAKFRERPYLVPENSWQKLLNFLVLELINYFVMTAGIAYTLLTVNRYDVIFVQKLKLRRISLWLSLNRKRIIYDMVDAPYASHSMEQEEYTGPTKDVLAMLQLSDRVIVENSLNEQFAKKYASEVCTILGPVNTERYQPANGSKDDGMITIGWIGSNDNTYYLQPVKPILEKLCQKYPKLEVKLIGTSKFQTAEPKIRLIDWSRDSELAELSSFNIGIMPLTDDLWAQSKGGYKLLQYMALGIPSVASPVGVNEGLLNRDGAGLAARSMKEWEEKLIYLIEHPQARMAIGQQARQMAEQKYSLTKSFDRFYNVIQNQYRNSK